LYQEWATYEDLKGMKYLRAVLHETLRVFPPVHTTLRASGSNAAVIPLTKSPGADPSSKSLSALLNGSGASTPTTPTFPLSSATPSLPSTPTTPHFQSQYQSELPLYVPPHTNISLVPLLIHRREDTWGPDSYKFDPDRWLDARNERVLRNPMMFVPFNAGPRICLGQQFALNQASYFLIRLLQTYASFELATDCIPRGCAPPPYWKEARGRAKDEKIFLAGAFTLFVRGGLWVRLRKAEAEE